MTVPMDVRTSGGGAGNQQQSDTSSTKSTAGKGKKNTSKAERSKQSARDCRTRKKLRYQYLEEMVICREKAVTELRKELNQLMEWSLEMDSGIIPDAALPHVTTLQKKFSHLNLSSLQTAESSVTSSATGDNFIGDIFTAINVQQQYNENNEIPRDTNLERNAQRFSDQGHTQVGSVLLTSDNLNDFIVSAPADTIQYDLDNTLLQQLDDWLLSGYMSKNAENFILSLT